MRSFGNFLVALLIGVAISIGLFLFNGCSSGVTSTDASIEDVSPLQPDFLPDKIDVSKACFDIAAALGDKMMECSGDSVQAAKFQQTLEDAWECYAIKSLRDGVEFYTLCIPAIKSLSCQQLQDADVPASCMGQLE